MRKQIEENISDVLKDLGLPKVKFVVEHPADESHGDWATNVAMVLAKKEKQNPKEIAQKIATELNKNTKSFVKSVEVAGPGFINISIKKEWLVSELERVLKSEDRFGYGGWLKNKKVVVEYTDPNPFKEFHIGHLYSNIVGESLCRLFEAGGATVWRADFFGDVGMHVAKAIWGLKQKMTKENVSIKVLEKMKIADRQKFMGKAYAVGATAFGEDKNAAEEIKQLNLVIFVATQEYWKQEKDWDPKIDYRTHIKSLDKQEIADVKKLWVSGRKWSLEYFETIYKRLGTKFDGYYPESLTGEWGYDFVLEGVKKGIFEKSKGAIIYKGEKKGFHTRVFINKLGLPTYETKDIGNAPMKYKDFKYDKSLIVTGNEIDGYFEVVIAAMKEVNPDLGNKTEHLGHGMVKLPKGKMSSRTGEIVRGEWLLDEAKRRVKQIISQSDGEVSKSDNQFSEKEENEITETVGMGAVRYALLKNSIGRDTAFDFEGSVSFEGNSGPYLQYTYARAQSVLAKAKLKNYELRSTNYDFHDEELAILRWAYRFPEVVESAGREYAPNQVCTYLYELAQRFNGFYNKHSILGSKKKPVSDKEQSFRLALTAAAAQVLKNGLYLLGIGAPSKM